MRCPRAAALVSRRRLCFRSSRLNVYIMVAVRDRPECHGEDPARRERERMVREQIAARGVRDPRVLAAMEAVPRHVFTGGRSLAESYGDHPVAIGQGQTVSQPYIVAFMIEALELPDGGRVLDIGTGSGYQAAVLAEAGFRVWSIEVRAALAQEAEARLRELGYAEEHIRLRHGDGLQGWPDAAPFDGIVGAAAAVQLPPGLLEQLAPHGVLVLPIGEEQQVLWRYRHRAGGFHGEELLDVRFVPMVSHL